MDAQEDPRVSKRKADDGLLAPAPRRIKALDQNVVNKIAAGEIIVAPVHALKELIENSADAGSTSIDILVKEGGLRLLQITDNGHGINKDDLPILCERFTTSKLKSFEDLMSIGTYGFRGEALASISHIAHLSVTTKTKDSSCAWRAVYSDGKLVPPKPGQKVDPKPVAGKDGTQITVEDLFYNIPSRRRAFRSPSEEYSKVLDVVGRYAVHCEGIAFSCKKHGDADMGVSTTATASLKDRIRRIHGSAVANELISLDVSDRHLGFNAKGMISNANYHVKKTTLLLFINGRSVESGSIKKAVEQTYTQYLPKGGHPFIYLSLDIEPHRVDVNVHPTKREVNFLYEDQIIEKICETVQESLAAVDKSRSFNLTQTLLPGSTGHMPGPSRLGNAATGSSARPPPKKTYENNTVRVDARDRKITTMLPTQPGPAGSGNAENGQEYEHDESHHWKLIKYSSIRELRQQVRDNAHAGLGDVFLNHIFVGLVDDCRRLAAVQHGVKLYLVDYAAISYEFFYQIGLSDFSNFGRIRLNPPLAVRDLLNIAADEEKRSGGGGAEDTDQDFDWEGATQTVESLLLDKRTMLKDYFSLEINDAGELVTIPLLLKGYMPCLGKLPSFLLRLGPNVDWTSELECFETFLRELALFYVPEALPGPTNTSVGREDDATVTGGEGGSNGKGGVVATNTVATTTTLVATSNDLDFQVPTGREDPAVMVRRREISATVETVLFPAFKKRLIPTNDLLRCVTEIANLKGLYRIFERSC